jgi:hypothetical protein
MSPHLAAADLIIGQQRIFGGLVWFSHETVVARRSTTGQHFTGAGAGKSNGAAVVVSQASGGSADAQLATLQQILAALNAQNNASWVGQ